MSSVPPPSDPRAIAQEIGRERLLGMWRSMLLIRRFEERAELAYKARKVAGFLHLYIGQEAVQTGFCAHLDPARDWTVTSYRCHALALLVGLPPRELMAELFGKATGNVRGKGGSMHFFSKERRLLGGHGIVGGQTPVGTGAAFAAKYLKTGGVGVTFMGDGAVAQGTLHESLNMAALWKLPAIFVVENNRYGMGTACNRAVAVESIAADKAPGYGMEGLTCDGLDLFSVWSAARRAVALARSGQPVLVEAKTYRYRGHSVSDAGLYRSKEELERYRALDPIQRVRQVAGELGWLDDAAAEQADERAQETVRDALDFAEQSPEPALDELARHVFAEEG